MTDHFGHLMAHIFTLWDLARERCSYSLRAGLCLLRAASFYWAIVSLALGGAGEERRAGGAVREFARSSRAVGATRRGTEGALSHISEEEEQENDGTEES